MQTRLLLPILWRVLLLTILTLAFSSYSALAQQIETSVQCNESSEPIPLKYGDHTVNCEINPAVDLDQFIFVGAAGDNIRLIVLGTTNSFEPRLEVRDPNNTVLVDTFCSSFASTCSLSNDLTLTLSGIYSIAVSDHLSDHIGGYILQLERIPPLLTPPPILFYNETVIDNINPETDVDFLTFEGAAGTTIRITVLGTTNSFEPRLEVRDPNNTVLVDTFCSSFASTCSLSKDLTLTLSGTYSIALADHLSDHIGGYQVSLQCVFGACHNPPPGTTTIGLYRPSTNTYYLRNSNTYGAPDLIIASFGAPGDLPAAGDWDGNGTTTIGLYRPSTNTFYLRNSNMYGAPDIVIASFGAPGDLPVVGDWDGNGTTTIGLYRPSTNTYYLRNSNTYGAPDIVIVGFGAPGDLPVVGDWTGSGTTTIGLYRPSTNTYYLRNSNTYGAPDIVIASFGAPNDLPVVGDWEGNGTTTIGLYRPSTNTYYLRNSNTYGAPDIVIAGFGAPGDLPVVGDWDGGP